MPLLLLVDVRVSCSPEPSVMWALQSSLATRTDYLKIFIARKLYLLN